MKLKKIVLLTIGLNCIFSFALGMMNDGFSHKKTPGEKVAQSQSQLLTKEKFTSVFGEGASFEAEKEAVNFNVFSNIEIAFDAPEKRHNLRLIKKIAKKYNQNYEANQTYLSILGLEEEAKDVHIDRIKEIAASYFSYHLKVDVSSVTFSHKSSGDQLGLIAKIEAETNKTKYYIKTHSAGLQSQHSSGAKILNPRELAVYKILEYLGIGCETHFFGRDLKNFYIATKDAKSIEYGYDFDTYGNLTKKIEIELKEIPKGIEEGLTALDLISRIMRLSDLQTNSGNFGFSSTMDDYIVRAIDFRIANDDMSYKIGEDHFLGLLEGNGAFNYGADKLINLVLREQDRDFRIARAKRVFNSKFSNYEKALKSTYEYVLNALRNTTTEDLSNLEALEKALKNYLQDIEGNFKFFQEKLNKPMVENLA